MLIQFYHIKTIRRNIVGGTAEGDEEEEAHRCLEPEGSRQREGDAGKGGSDERLHGEHPPALGLQQVDERAPQGLDHPRQGEPSGIETHLGIGEAQLHIHHHREGGHNDVGQSFCKIEGRNPSPWIPAIFLCYHFIFNIRFRTSGVKRSVASFNTPHSTFKLLIEFLVIDRVS